MLKPARNSIELPSVPLLLLMILGIGLRLWLAWSRFDRVWADEHFQTIEPAAKLFHGQAYLTWEWLQGYRSWLLPAFHLPFFWLGSLFDATYGLALVRIVRTGYALADAAVWLSLFHHLDRRGILSPAAARLGLALALLSPATLLWSVTSLQDHLAMILFWGALPWIWMGAESRRPIAWIATGFLLILPTWAKLQIAPACATLGIALGIARRSIEKRDPAAVPFARKSLGVLTGAVAGTLFYCTIDWLTWGRFAGSAIQQLALGGKLANNYGTSPWWSYLPRTGELLGPELSIALALVLIAALFSAFTRRPSPSRDQSLIRTLILVALVHYAAHSWIPHKETRFLLPMLPALLVIALSLLPGHSLPAALARLMGPVPAGLLAFAAALGGGTIAHHRPVYYTSVEVGPLEEAIARARSKAPLTEIQLCLVGHFWSWTRGSVGVGGPVAYQEFESIAERPSSEASKLSTCDYAIVRNDQVPAFMKAQSSFAPQWIELAPPVGNFTVWKKE